MTGKMKFPIKSFLTVSRKKKNGASLMNLNGIQHEEGIESSKAPPSSRTMWFVVPDTSTAALEEETDIYRQ